ncbi:hypothetical protein L6164_004777 [Bauhinia variegata]|uniref:Uncharacterized protein n=1 Tax=Bauhinia variegata TaxID=167791 RepID=A0ACB9PNB6_BAUVA|nr:hypothetical protein L6164_004777 [Bauhinia variegata]
MEGLAHHGPTPCGTIISLSITFVRHVIWIGNLDKSKPPLYHHCRDSGTQIRYGVDSLLELLEFVQLNQSSSRVLCVSIEMRVS